MVGPCVRVSPFTDSTSDHMMSAGWLGCALWVWLGGTQCCCWFGRSSPLCVGVGLGMLLGPEGTPGVGVVLWSAPGLVV